MRPDDPLGQIEFLRNRRDERPDSVLPVRSPRRRWGLVLAGLAVVAVLSAGALAMAAVSSQSARPVSSSTNAGERNATTGPTARSSTRSARGASSQPVRTAQPGRAAPPARPAGRPGPAGRPAPARPAPPHRSPGAVQPPGPPAQPPGVGPPAG